MHHCFAPILTNSKKTFPNSTDVVFFDGASNVQKAGQVLQVTYPRIEVLHGAEHVVSLFFNDLFNFPEFKALYSIAQRTYRIFGSGSRHGAHAIFQKYAIQHNNRKNIGLMRAAGTRMAGAAIVMLRLLRLRPAVISTVNSAEFCRLKVSCIVLLSYFIIIALITFTFLFLDCTRFM